MASDHPAGTTARFASLAPWALVLSLVGVAGALWHLGAAGAPSASTSFHLSWIAVALGFFAAESWGGLHLRLRGHAQTIGVGEIPLTLGLLFCTPHALILASCIGGGLALLLDRGRREPIKVAFNLALFAVSASVATAVLQPLCGPIGTLGPRVWFAVIVATLAADLVSFAALTAVFTLTSGIPSRRELRDMLVFGAAETLATTIVALLPATVLVFDARAAWLLVVPAISLVMAVRAVGRKQVLAERVDHLYEEIRTAKLPDAIEDRAHGLLASARELFDADHAELVLFEAGTARRYASPELPERSAEGIARWDDRLIELVGKRSMLFERDSARRIGADGAMHHRGLTRMMTTALRGDADLTGLLLVGDRRRRPDSAAHDDLLRFEAFAAHANASLQMARLLELQRQLAHEARHDPLTGLGNRLRYREATLGALAEHHSAGVAVLYVDISDFKLVNGRLGHGAGDEALRQIARRIEGALPAGDLVVRLGGDEFACVLRDAGASEAMRRARLVVSALDDEIRLDGHTFLLRACVGVTCATEHSSPDDLLTEADLALHESQVGGPGGAVAFTVELREAATERRQLEHDLRRGIAAGELEAHYQPLISLATGHLYGFEALVRWRHPDRGLISPAVFLPTAERTGLIGELGREVLRQACDQARTFDALMGPACDLVMSVNLSGAQIGDASLAQHVAAALERSGADPSRLWLEVTETVAMEDVAQTSERLRELRALGVGLALDDFGTGYSSLSYMKEFPFTVLKIARELITGDASAADDTILEAIVLLADRFGMTTVAEGIELDDQATRVRAHGCNVGQGFLWSRPLDANAAERLVRASASPPLAA